MKIIPNKIRPAPMKSIIPKYEEVPTVTSPLMTVITIDTLYFCINFTVKRNVKYIEIPVTIMTAH